MQENRRRFPRLPAPPNVYASYIGGAGKIVDLSLGGVKIRDREPVFEGQRFNLRMHLGSEIIEGSGVVRRSVPGRGMCIEFTDMEPQQRIGLHRYIANARAGSGSAGPETRA